MICPIANHNHKSLIAPWHRPCKEYMMKKWSWYTFHFINHPNKAILNMFITQISHFLFCLGLGFVTCLSVELKTTAPQHAILIRFFERWWSANPDHSTDHEMSFKNKKVNLNVIVILICNTVICSEDWMRMYLFHLIFTEPGLHF